MPSRTAAEADAAGWYLLLLLAHIGHVFEEAWGRFFVAEWMGLGGFLLVNWILLAIPIALFHQVLRGTSWAFRLATLYALVMALNGAGHLVGFLVTGRYVSGFAGAATGGLLVVLGIGLMAALRGSPRMPAVRPAQEGTFGADGEPGSVSH